MEDHPIRIHPFLTVMHSDQIYDTADMNMTILRHAAWLTNHWDDLINEQNRIKERGVFIATETSSQNVDFKMEFLPLRNIGSLENEHIRKQLLLKVEDMDLRDEFVICFISEELMVDMCYHIPLAKYLTKF